MNDVVTIARKASEGEEPYKGVLDAMLYTVAKQAGAMYVTLRGQVDAIILTGGIAHSDYCVGILKEQIDYLAPVVLMPGEDEMGSLAYNALGALKGESPFAGLPAGIRRWWYIGIKISDKIVQILHGRVMC